MDAARNATTELAPLMNALGRDAATAARVLARATTAAKNAALTGAAAAIRDRRSHILEANRRDLHPARERNLSTAMPDRLLLDEKRVGAMARGVENTGRRNEPIGVATAEWTRPNGLTIRRVRVPLGVV